MRIETIPRIKTVVKKFTSLTGEAIVPIFDNTVVDTTFDNVIHVNGFLKNLKAHAQISSLTAVKLPNFKLEDSETDKLYKTLDIEWGSARKQLNLYISDNSTDWYEIAAISLLNPSGYPYRMYNLLDLLTPNLAAELGSNSRIGIQIKDVGYGSLQGTDVVTIHGSYLQEIIVNSDYDLIMVTNNFSEIVEQESIIILQPNPNRKYVGLTNAGEYRIYVNFGSVAIRGKGITLNAYGGSFDFDKPYYGAISAIGEDNASIISGVECS